MMDVFAFPDEEENIRFIEKAYAQLFLRAAGAMAVAIEAFNALCVAKSPAHKTRAVIIAILAEQIRRYRSILLLCRIGSTDNADILARTAFEGLLAERFILKRGKYKGPIPSGHRASDFRAVLYSVSVALQMLDVRANADKTKGLKRFARKAHQIADNATRDAIRKTIGARWFKVLTEHPYTFSGMSIKALSAKLGLISHYVAVYRPQSTKTHAGRANDGIIIADQPLVYLIGDIEALPRTMIVASDVLLMLTQDIDHVFKLGLHDAIHFMRAEAVQPFSVAKDNHGNDKEETNHQAARQR